MFRKLFLATLLAIATVGVAYAEVLVSPYDRGEESQKDQYFFFDVGNTIMSPTMDLILHSKPLGQGYTLVWRWRIELVDIRQSSESDKPGIHNGANDRAILLLTRSAYRTSQGVEVPQTSFQLELREGEQHQIPYARWCNFSTKLCKDHSLRLESGGAFRQLRMRIDVQEYEFAYD